MKIAGRRRLLAKGTSAGGRSRSKPLALYSPDQIERERTRAERDKALRRRPTFPNQPAVDQTLTHIEGVCHVAFRTRAN